MPQVLYVSGTDSPFPRWVAAEAAFDQHGEVITELCHEAACALLNEIAETPRDPTSGCVEREETYQLFWDPPDRSTLDKSVKNSQLVFLGKVVDKAYGFKGGTPGQLIRVASTRDFKGMRALDLLFSSRKFHGWRIQNLQDRSIIPHHPDSGR